MASQAMRAHEGLEIATDRASEITYFGNGRGEGDAIREGHQNLQSCIPFLMQRPKAQAQSNALFLTWR